MDELAPDKLRALSALLLIPPFLHVPVALDRDFRARMPVPLEGTIGVGSASFDRSAFLAAVQRAYQTGEAKIVDATGEAWRLAALQHDPGLKLELSLNDDTMRLGGMPGLHPDAAVRLAHADRVFREAGVSLAEHDPWRMIIADRPLQGDELDGFETEVSAGPLSIGRALRDALLAGQAKMETLVPHDQRYYVNLTGVGDVPNLNDYIVEVAPPHVAAQLARDPEVGARQALLLGSQGMILGNTALATLDGDAFLALGRWVAEHGDPLAKCAYAELGLHRVATLPELEEVITPLITDLRDSKTGEDSPLYYLMALYVLVDGELARVGTLAAWPPFRRRIATLAHAAVLLRESAGVIDTVAFARWCIEARAYHYRLRGLIDLRAEPRWEADHFVPDQLWQYIMGRLLDAASSAEPPLPEGHLRQLMLADAPGTIRQQVRFPMAFLPGPLEGGLAMPLVDLPADIAELIEEQLSAETIRPANLTAFINASAIFRVPTALVDLAIERIEAAGATLLADSDTSVQTNTINGLAHSAATLRRPDLAKLVWILARRRRNDGATTAEALVEELHLALTAAAANDDELGWARAFGEWSSEIAWTVEDVDAASHLLNTLQTLARLEPGLRPGTGRAAAALKLKLGRW